MKTLSLGPPDTTGPLQPVLFNHHTPEGLLPPEFPLTSILHRSVFYPCCFLDAAPVRFLNRKYRSFVYADYNVTRPMLIRELRNRGFRGYRCLLQRDVLRREIVPPDWKPPILPTQYDGGIEGLRRTESRCQPFGHWSIWKAESGDEEDWFSFFFMAGEASAAYQGLYLRNGIAPEVLAIIQPGSGCGGGGWTRTEGEGAFFHRIVKSGPMPEHLMWGGIGRGRDYDRSCWPSDYPELVEKFQWIKPLRLFRRKD